MEQAKAGRSVLWQFLRYNIVGILNTAVDYLVFTLLVKAFAVGYLVANPIAYGCGLVNSYVLNSRWTFKEQTRRGFRQAAAFFIVNLLAMGISTGLMWLLQQEGLVQDALVRKLIAAPATLAVNFLGNKLLVFRQRKEPSQS